MKRAWGDQTVAHPHRAELWGTRPQEVHKRWKTPPEPCRDFHKDSTPSPAPCAGCWTENRRHQKHVYIISMTSPSTWSWSSVTDLFLHSEEFDDVLVVEFLQNLKLPHLNIQRPQKTQVVEHFDRIQVASFLQMNSKTCSLTHWILEIYGAWLKDFGQKICLHEKNDVILNWHDRNVNTWYFLQVSWQFVEMQTCKGRGNS